MAHLVEHVTFLGSTKRENLHGTGARSNAYTDFHHTVFHVHAPQKSMAWGQTPLLPKVPAASTSCVHCQAWALLASSPHRHARVHPTRSSTRQATAGCPTPCDEGPAWLGSCPR